MSLLWYKEPLSTSSVCEKGGILELFLSKGAKLKKASIIFHKIKKYSSRKKMFSLVVTKESVNFLVYFKMGQVVLFKKSGTRWIQTFWWKKLKWLTCSYLNEKKIEIKIIYHTKLLLVHDILAIIYCCLQSF